MSGDNHDDVQEMINQAVLEGLIQAILVDSTGAEVGYRLTPAAKAEVAARADGAARTGTFSRPVEKLLDALAGLAKDARR